MNLSPEQKAAIDHRGSHLQIIACAGSGKTEVMARRVAALVEEKVPPAAILAFTFTDRAATSLKLRIHQRISEAMGKDFLDHLGPMFVGTIHSYCLRMLQDHVPHFGNYDRREETVWMNYEPALLHETTYLGDDFRKRESIKRKRLRWTARFRNEPVEVRQAVLSDLSRVFLKSL